MPDKKTIAIVTGASRGAGRGIAIALGSHGCTVYVTGRSTRTGETTSLPGTIFETADAITAAGGEGIAVCVDHADDSQVKTFFEQVQREQGRLDILVNNVCAIYDELTSAGNFWEKSLDLANMIDVGIRSSYVASYYAAPIMVEQQHGLIIFSSSSGSVHYCYGPAYGAHKASLDKFAADMAVDFKPYNVATMSIWMGALKTDRMRMVLADMSQETIAQIEAVAETPELTGHVIWGLYNDSKLMALSGQTVFGAEKALEYGIKDKDGNQPPSMRGHHGEPRVQHPMIIR